MARTRKHWTDQEKQKLAEVYPNMKAIEVAKILRRSLPSIYGMVDLMGISKSENFKKSEQSGRILKGQKTGSSHRFKKGHQPFNKGKKIEDFMSEETIKKFKSNSYKKGQMPHNTLYDGCITQRNWTDGNTYKMIRTSLSKWEFLHVHIWKQQNGEVPKGKIIVFDDNDRNNFAIENLKAITRKELAERARQTDGMIASYLSGKNEKTKAELLKHKEILALKRQLINLKKEINGKL
jgi:hypothetical protein